MPRFGGGFFLSTRETLTQAVRPCVQRVPGSFPLPIFFFGPGCFSLLDDPFFGLGGVFSIRRKTSSPFLSSICFSVSVMANPIETDFKLALALGRLAGRWGQAELGVELLYIILSEMPHRKATISFSFHKSVSTQKDIISLLADETAWLTEEERSAVKQAAKEFADMSAERNGWIHYPFGIDESSGEAEIYKMKRMRRGDILYSKQPSNPAIINEFSARVKELTDRLYRVHSVLMLAYERKLKQPPLDRTPSTWSLIPQKYLKSPPEQ